MVKSNGYGHGLRHRRRRRDRRRCDVARRRVVRRSDSKCRRSASPCWSSGAPTREPRGARRRRCAHAVYDREGVTGHRRRGASHAGRPHGCTSRSTPAWAGSASSPTRSPSSSARSPSTRPSSRSSECSRTSPTPTRADFGFTEHQHACFVSAVDEVRSVAPDVLAHCSNSGAILRAPHMHHDIVRPGIALYGYAPDVAARRRRPADRR